VGVNSNIDSHNHSLEEVHKIPAAIEVVDAQLTLATFSSLAEGLLAGDLIQKKLQNKLSVEIAPMTIERSANHPQLAVMMMIIKTAMRDRVKTKAGLVEMVIRASNRHLIETINMTSRIGHVRMTEGKTSTEGVHHLNPTMMITLHPRVVTMPLMVLVIMVTVVGFLTMTGVEAEGVPLFDVDIAAFTSKAIVTLDQTVGTFMMTVEKMMEAMARLSHSRIGADQVHTIDLKVVVFVFVLTIETRRRVILETIASMHIKIEDDVPLFYVRRHSPGVLFILHTTSRRIPA